MHIPIRLIERHEIGVNLIIPKTLVFGPRQCGKTAGVKYAISQIEDDLYTVFVHNKQIKDYRYANLRNIHLAEKIKTLDIDTVATKIFVDDIDLCDQFIPLSFLRIYSATCSKLDFNYISSLAAQKNFPFERICIVNFDIV